MDFFLAQVRFWWLIGGRGPPAPLEGNRDGQHLTEQKTGMAEPETDEGNNQLLAEAERFRRNARAFLIALARFVEVCEAREGRRAQNNPWAAGQVTEN